MKLNEDLYWIASYPKSGNTWVRTMVAVYLKELGVARGACRFDDLNPYFHQVVSPKPLDDLTHPELMALRPAVLSQMLEYNNEPMFCKTHHVCGTVAGMLTFAHAWSSGVIYVVRDPRDVAPSFADHLGESIDHAIEAMADETRALKRHDANLFHATGTWSRHVESWTERNTVEVHTVRYEDLQEDAAGELAAMMRAMDFPVDRALCEAVAEETTFEKMKQVEAAHGFRGKSSQQDRFFRRGETGTWQETLTEAQVRRIEADHGAQMEKMGYELTTAVEVA